MAHNDFAACHRYQGNDFEKLLTPHATIAGHLQEWAGLQPDETYLISLDTEGLVQKLTYGELENLSRRLASWFSHELELRYGDVVALLPSNDLRSVVTIFALLRAGCSIFFINPTEPRKRLDELLSALTLKAVLAPSSHVCAQQSVSLTIPEFANLREGRLPEVSLDARQSAFYFGTSGSTAISKIVCQSHYNAAINAEALARHHGLGPGVRLLGCLPIHHVNGLHFTLFATLWSGAQAILLESFNSALYQQSFVDYQPTIASVVPSILESLLLSWRIKELPPEFRYFVSAAAPLPARTCASVFERLGARVLQGYGLTETTNFSTTLPGGLSATEYRRLMIDTDIPSVGVALYGNEVTVLRSDGTRAEPGETGELCMRGHNVMLGYAGNEVATADAFRNGWFHSQDLGYERRVAGSEQTCFIITGRQKNMAKVLGVAVSLEEMERTLLKLDLVADAACFAVRDQLLGEAVVAAVVSNDPLDPKRLNAHLKDYFGPGTLPAKYIQAEAIPRTATGKIIRSQLPLLFGGARREETPAKGDCGL